MELKELLTEAHQGCLVAVEAVVKAHGMTSDVATELVLYDMIRQLRHYQMQLHRLAADAERKAGEGPGPP